MITAAVLQSSQLVEIQGAPSNSPDSGDEFRATFAATLDTPSSSAPEDANGAAATAATSEQTSKQTSKQTSVPQPFLKSTTIAAKSVPPSTRSDDAKSPVDTAPGATADSASASGLTSDLDAVLASSQLVGSKTGLNRASDLDRAGGPRPLLPARARGAISPGQEGPVPPGLPGTLTAGGQAEWSKLATGVSAHKGKDETPGPEAKQVPDLVAAGVVTLVQSALTGTPQVHEPAGISAKAVGKEAAKGVPGAGATSTPQTTGIAPGPAAPPDAAALGASESVPVTGSLQSASAQPMVSDSTRDKIEQGVTVARDAGAARSHDAAAKSGGSKSLEASSEDATSASSSVDAASPGVLASVGQSIAASPTIAATPLSAATAAVPVAEHPGASLGVAAHGDGPGAGAARALSSVGDSSAGAGPLTGSASSASPVAGYHQTLVATPTTLEVGVQSGTQGWLRIRADIGEQGQVTASVAAASSGGRELLHSQMPDLNAFLHNEQIGVSATVADRGGAGTVGSQGGEAQGSGGAGTQSNGTQTGGGDANASLAQRRGAEPEALEPSSEMRPMRGVDPVSGYDAHTVASGVDGLPTSRRDFEASGRWLNVRV